MDWVQAIVLAVVQGLTEFLPISSAGHLVLVPVFLGWEDQGLAFDVALHLGSLIAVVWYFRHELARMITEWLRSLRGGPLSADARLAWAVGLGTIPVGVAGLVFQDVIALQMRSPVVIGVALIGFGLLLGLADWRWRGEKSEYTIGWREVTVIAFAQALALIPGTSRSGITMTAALFMGMSREGASRFSFLLSIPVIALAGGLETTKLAGSPEPVNWVMVVVATVVSGIAAWLCIHYFLVFIRRIGMQPFVVYRLVLGTILLSVFWGS